MPQDKPTCQKCGQRHWYFKKCEAVKPPVQWIQRPPEGFHVWGDRMHTYQHQGGNVFVLPRKHKPTGTVTPPPPEAA